MMFLSAILLALLVGALLGGGIPRLAQLNLRWLPLLGLALAFRILALIGGIRFGMVFAAEAGLLLTYGLLFVWLWGNRQQPGLQIAAIGIATNAAAVLLNGGQMPIWSGALSAAGFTPADVAGDGFHFILEARTAAEFVAAGGLLGDVIPIPLPIIRDVVSIGDVLLAVGIFATIVFSMTRADAPLRRERFAAARIASPSMSSMNAGVAYAGTLAGTAPGGIGPMALPQPSMEGVRPSRPESAYLRLARNRNFVLLWVGQAISFFGDRIHQVALAGIVASRGPGSEIEVGFTFAATAIPNVLLGPLAGALVDRWDRKRTMVASDIARAVLVLSVPFAIEISILLVYLIAFALATVSLLFRPAKTAVLPLVVHDDELVTANSASTVSETGADLIGYPVAGLIVAALSGIIGTAFVLDAGTYLISAILIGLMVVPHDPEQQTGPMKLRAVWADIVDGWQFLRHQTELFANTMVSMVAQLVVGAEVVVSILYAQHVLEPGSPDYLQVYGFLMASVGLGSVVGGILIGAIAARFRKGPMIIAGYAGIGLAMMAVGFVDETLMALVLYFVIGAMNMLFLIPSITLFQERTPQRLMGRVVSTRQSLVFGSIATSMALSGWLAAVVGPSTVFVIAGAACTVAGLAGLLVPAMRDAR
ncbi:MAG: MFS transporter [Chloroflexota bacterium]